ncbi:TonB-dependent receptor [Sphingomonas sp. SFZ2018-12]|uniref:TonB-dependent receptor n=1 Tax=Sphingomonas sp. SFZ2018-12 TaxID=2683197 RepID=UPI001F0F322E|nr:TonB-dependent receptor [Sphingomonas sp. SFZ2018-12]MCH4894784.1 TonB-dependent receptor [Sphingomonas sp. SFZ2018-12]
MKVSSGIGRIRAAVLASAIGLMGAPVGAMAQDAGPPADTEAQTDDPLPGDIVVTARRRAESLQDVPISISAFGEDALSNLQADTLSGIQYATPNLYLDQGDAGNAVIYIRGVGQNDSLAFADPGVGVYVDDVFISRSQAAFLEVFDVERIEVLRGPQGTLYGRNTIGGAIKFVSTRPTRDVTAYGEVGYGNFDSLILKGRLSGPIAGDTLRAKVAFAYSKRDGYNQNSFTGQDDGDVDTLSGRVSLLFEPSSDVEFLLSADGRVDRPDTSRSPVRETPITGAIPGGLVTFPASPGDYQVDTNANGLSDQTGWGVALTSRWFVNDKVTVESITSYREFRFDLNLDTDGSRLPILDILLNQDQRQFSQELRLTYEDPDNLTFTGGLYYFYDDDTTFSGVDNGAATIFGFPVTLFGFASSSLAETRQETNSYAIFGDATYQLTDRLSISAGLRYTTEDRSSGRLFENFFNPAISTIRNTPPFLAGVGVAGRPINGEASFDAFTPRGSISYQASDDVLLYASASRGFKSGGFDGRASTDFAFQPFRPEFVWSYEGGAKTSWLDGRLTLNGSVFYNDYTDVQVTSFGSDPVTGVFVSLFTNAASASAWGAELELLAQPTDGLAITGSLGLLDANYDRFDILVGGVVTDVSDRRVVNAPDFNASLGATYTAPLSSYLSATFHVDGSYRSTVATEITDSPLLRQEGYERINAFVALNGPQDRWQLRAGVENLTDRNVRVQGFNLQEFPGVQVGFFSAPRTYDLRLIVRY